MKIIKKFQQSFDSSVDEIASKTNVDSFYVVMTIFIGGIAFASGAFLIGLKMGYEICCVLHGIPKP